MRYTSKFTLFLFTGSVGSETACDEQYSRTALFAFYLKKLHLKAANNKSELWCRSRKPSHSQASNRIVKFGTFTDPQHGCLLQNAVCVTVARARSSPRHFGAWAWLLRLEAEKNRSVSLYSKLVHIKGTRLLSAFPFGFITASDWSDSDWTSKLSVGISNLAPLQQSAVILMKLDFARVFCAIACRAWEHLDSVMLPTFFSGICKLKTSITAPLFWVTATH